MTAVVPPVSLQAQAGCGGCHELPQACCIDGRPGTGFKGALNKGQQCELGRQIALLDLCYDFVNERSSACTDLGNKAAISQKPVNFFLNAVVVMLVVELHAFADPEPHTVLKFDLGLGQFQFRLGFTLGPYLLRTIACLGNASCLCGQWAGLFGIFGRRWQSAAGIDE